MVITSDNKNTKALGERQKNMTKITGTVFKSTGSWYKIHVAGETFVKARLKGKIRLQGLKSTNPIAVGDEVELDENEDGSFTITSIKERKNYLVRRSVNLSKQIHIVAANIDMLYIVFSLKKPVTTTIFLDRIIVMAEAFDIPISIIFNKIDLYNKEELNDIELYEYAYKSLGYATFKTSIYDKKSLALLQTKLNQGVSTFVGHSGAGKSSLINSIDPGLNLKTNAISDAFDAGKHTTTYAEMHFLSKGGKIIDSPGVKGFGITEVNKDELALHFPEMKGILNNCKFYNCKHINEPNCAVKKAVNEGDVAPWRYQSYLSMYNDDGDNPYRVINYDL